MKKSLFPILLFASAILLATAHAQFIVEDPGAIAQSAVQHTIDLAKYVEMIGKQVEQINLLTSQLEQVTAYKDAFGDPSSLLKITGAREVASQLQQPSSGQLLSQLQQNASGSGALINNGNGLYRPIETISLNGTEIPRSEELYKKYGALENSSANYQSVHEDSASRIQALKGEIASTTTALEAATTDAEVQKLQGVLVTQNAQLSALQGEVQNAASQVIVQDAMNRNDMEKQDQAQREKDAAEWSAATRQFDELLTIPNRKAP